MTEPYKKISSQNIYKAKRPVVAEMAAIVDLRMDDRELALIVPQSRAVRQGELFEIVTTTEPSAGPGSQVNSVAYLGFAEVQTGGMILVGDTIKFEKGPTGRVVGFDETHAPNHINVVVHMEQTQTGGEAGLVIEDKVVFQLDKEQ